MMKSFNPLVLILLFGCFANANLYAAGMNTEKAILAQQQQIQQLKRDNKALIGRIEVLRQQGQINARKIKELFELIDYKTTDEVVQKTILRIKNNNQKIKKSYTDARDFLLDAQYDTAIKLFAEHRKLYPDSDTTADATYWLAKAYLAKKDYQNAEKILQQFQQNNATHHKFANSLYELADIYALLGKKNKAQKLLQSLLQNFPTHNIIKQAKQLLTRLKKQAQKQKKQ